MDGDPVRTYMDVCPECLSYASAGGVGLLRSAAASVGLEHGISTEQALNEMFAQYHANGHTFRSADV